MRGFFVSTQRLTQTKKFNAFSQAVDARLQRFLADAREGKCVLLRSSIIGDELYTTYLTAFPAGTNPIFRERTEHDCNCCKNFIRNVGTLLAVYPDHVQQSLGETGCTT